MNISLKCIDRFLFVLCYENQSSGGFACISHLELLLYFPIYIQQDATLRSLFYLETALHVSGGNSIHHQERIQLYLQHLVFVRPLLLPAAIAAGSSNGVTNTSAVDTVVCAPDDEWWHHPKHVEQFPDKINCVTLRLVGYILEYNYDA